MSFNSSSHDWCNFSLQHICHDVNQFNYIISDLADYFDVLYFHHLGLELWMTKSNIFVNLNWRILNLWKTFVLKTVAINFIKINRLIFFKQFQYINVILMNESQTNLARRFLIWIVIKWLRFVHYQIEKRKRNEKLTKKKYKAKMKKAQKNKIK